MKIILHWIVLSLAVLVTAYFVPGIIVSSFWVALIVGACLGFINLIIKPIINILTLPLNVLTLGLFSLVINGAFFYFLATLIKGFSVDSFKAAFIGAIVVSVINWIGDKVLY